MLPNDFDSHRTMLGLAWLRVVEVPLNGALTGGCSRYSLDHADVTTIVVAPEYADAVDAVRGELPALTRIIVLDDAGRDRVPRRR